jgi:DNA-binding NarL/FixJ family response regulator
VRSNDRRRAARSAFWLGLLNLFRGEAAKSSGWLSRAERLIEGESCVEHGYLLLPQAEQQLMAGDSDAALSTATAATRVGSTFGDPDLVSCALHLEGRARLQKGDVLKGLALLDEAMIAVSAGEVSPLLTGLMYCSVIEECQRVFALDRAWEWTSALTRWCDLQSGLVAFTRACLVYRAEIMQLRGAWTEAIDEVASACERSARSGRKAPAAVFYRQGEIHRLRGDLSVAEEAYRAASNAGCEPLPGLALLRAAQGRNDAARAAITRVLDAASDPLSRAKLLPAFVEIALLEGDLTAARTGATELESIARQFETGVLLAMACHASGSVHLAAGNAAEAIGELRRAFEHWQRVHAPYESARSRMLIGLACRQLGDLESADLELDAATAALEELGAAPDLARLRSLRAGGTRAKGEKLTSREMQVLRQIIAGDTNRAIATRLSLSERTIDRHVSNILTKLGVPSRAAATAYAYSHKLI